MKQKISQFILSYWFTIFLFLLFSLSALLRFYHYPSRFGLAYDQAHDAIIARYSLEHHKLPLLGPFSSAGPFQTGGEWYWIIMLGTAIYPFALTSPWVFLTFLYCLFVVGIAYFGDKIVDRRFAIIVGLLAAFSPAQTIQGLNLTNQTPQAIISLIAVVSSYAYMQKKEIRYLFFLALSIGLGISIHLQGVGILPLLVVTFLMGRKYSIAAMSACFFGVLIPWIPNLIIDTTHNFVNIRNMLQYYLHDQYSISLEVLGRRWKTYLSLVWPAQWGFITGGNKVVGGLLFGGSLAFIGGLSFAQFFKKEKDAKSTFFSILLLSFTCSLILLRYTRTPLFESYFVFLHPFVLLLSAYFIYKLTQLRKLPLLGYLLFVVVILGSLLRIGDYSRSASNFSAIEGDRRIKLLQSKFPKQTFSVYTYKFNWSDKNSVLLLYLYKNNMLSADGKKVGVVVATQSGEFTFPILEGGETGYQLLDMSSSSSGTLKKSGWIEISPESFYRETEDWFLYHK